VRNLIFASFLLLPLLYPSRISAQVVINEVLNNPLKNLENNEKGKEWVELINNSATPTSLSGCTLYLDDSTSNQKIVFDEEEFIDKYKVFSWDDSWLNNLGDTIKLECVNFSDIVSYGDLNGAVCKAPKPGVTFGRSPDGSGSFSLLGKNTMGEANSLPPTETPMPTPTPVPTQKPANTIKPEKTATPVLTPKPLSTNTIIPHITKNLVLAESDDYEEKIASDETTMYVPTLKYFDVNKKESGDPGDEESEAKVAGNKKRNPYPFIIIVVGLFIISLSFYRIIKNFGKKI